MEIVPKVCAIGPKNYYMISILYKTCVYDFTVFVFGVAV